MQAENFIGLGPITKAKDVYLGEEDEKADQPTGADQAKREAGSKKSVATAPLISLQGGAEFHVGAEVKMKTVGEMRVSKDSKLVVSQHAQLAAA